VPLDQVDVTKRQKTVGFLTALAWFAKEKSRASDAVWDDLQKCTADRLPGFFSRRAFRKCCRLDGRGNLRMVPLIPPDMLHTALAKLITGYQGCSDTISLADSTIWTKWNWWDWLILGIFEKRLQECRDSILAGLNPPEEAMLDSGASDRVRDAWFHFMETLRASRSVLLFAQRKWIIQWFDFDPSLPELLEDKNRPWDYDHIHAQNYLQGKNGGGLWYLPKVIKSWHGCIGNLRAWPLEANRALGDNSPMDKLGTVSLHEKRYAMNVPEDVRAASFVTEDHWKELWSKCVPADNAAGYLTDAGCHAERKILVKAVIWRLVAIYRHWYETLRLADLNE
jgi:hypothetical protein